MTTFPTSPSNGETFTNGAGEELTFDGIGWSGGGSGGASLTAASAAEIIAGTDSTKYVTPSALAAAEVVPSGGTPTANAYSASPSFDFDNGLSHIMGSVTGDVVVGTPANAAEGDEFILQFKQDAVGGHNITFGAWADFGDEGAPSMSTAANSRSAITGKMTSATTAMCAPYGTGFSV